MICDSGGTEVRRYTAEPRKLSETAEHRYCKFQYPPSLTLVLHLPSARLRVLAELRESAEEQLGGGRAASGEVRRQEGGHAAQRRRQQQLAGLHAHYFEVPQ